MDVSSRMDRRNAYRQWSQRQRMRQEKKKEEKKCSLNEEKQQVDKYKPLH